MPEDTPGEEQRTMLTFTEAAERLVKDQIAQSMTAEGLRRLARDPASGWPIGPSDYRMAGKVRMLPYELLAPYMRERLGKRRGRGPDMKKRSPKPKQQGDPVTVTVDPRIAALTETVERTLKSLRGGYHHLPPKTETVLTEELVNALTPLLLAQRPAVLREAADRYATLADQNEAHERAEHGSIDHESRLQYEAVRDVAAGLRHMAEES
jgi:hypothetical protein